MRRGIGALFVAFLAVRVMTAPPSAPTAPSATPAAQQKSSSARARRPSGVAPRPDQSVSAKQRSPAAESSDACESSEKCPKKGLLDAIEAALGSTKAEEDLVQRVGELTQGAKNVHVVVATVPDPAHTHLSLLFDRQVVAIEEAVQQGGYLFSRAYLPWDNVQHAEDTDFRVRLGEQDYQDVREEYPGILVFHSAESLGDPKGPLLVFLVAETPTGGINKDQFFNAVRTIGAICPAGCAAPQPLGNGGRFFILGPTFSGSLYSLRDILAKLSPLLREVVVHSGTATDNDTIGWFTDPRQIAPAPFHLDFRTFEEGNDYAMRRLANFFCLQGYRPGQIALLSEDETAYGAGENLTIPGNSSPPAVGESCSNASSRILHLFFPRDISALRNAYQQDLKASASSSNVGAPRSTLSLNLEDHGNNDDSVAIFSSDQTPLSEEAVMMGIVADLREHRSNIVVIQATNDVDMIFLVRYLRRAYSDARMIIIGSDLLFPQQVDDPRLRGVMQVTTYSLIPEIDRYTATTGDRCAQPLSLNRIFPTDTSVGTFNAALSLLESQQSAHPLKGCHPDPAPDGRGDEITGSAYAQYGWPVLAGEPGPGKDLLPPLWLTAQGRDQFWPVELLDGPDVPNPSGTPPSLLHPIQASASQIPKRPRLPASWNFLSALGAAFALIYALLARNGALFSSSSTFLTSFARVDIRWRKWTILFCAVVFFDILACLLWPYFWFLRSECWIGVCVFAVLGWLFVSDLARRGDRIFLTWFAALVIFSWGVLWIAFGLQPGALRRLALYRYAHFSSGVSSVVPFLLLFAACLWVGWHALSGLPPWDRGGTGPELPSMEGVLSSAEFGGESPADRARLVGLTSRSNANLLSFMAPENLNRRVLGPASIVWLLFVLGGIMPSSPHRLQSFEGPWYDYVYTVFVAALLFILLCAAVRMVRIWLELRRLLMVLDRLPLRRGFARLAGFSSKRLWQLGGSTFEDYFAIWSKEIQTATSLAYTPPVDVSAQNPLRTATANVAQFAWWYQHLDPELIRLELKDARLTHLTCDRFLDLQSSFTTACAAVLRELNETWNKEARPVWDAECMVQEGKQCDDTELPLRVRLCEDFVCLFYLKFITSVFTRMRALVLTIAGLYVFLLLSFGSYPFEPSSAFHTAMVFLLILIVAAIAIVYGQAEKNATISRITQTKVGELGFEFWLRLTAVVSVPLLSLLAAKFPEISGFLFSWLEPASQAFR